MRIVLLALFDEWCLGLRSLSSVLKSHGHEAVLVYFRSMGEMHDEAGLDNSGGYHAPPGSVAGKDFRALDDLIRSLRPDLIGISLTSNFYGLAERITHNLHETAPSVPVLWGGIDPTANPDLALESADMACIGEGEGALTDLAAKMSLNEDIGSIANLCFKRNGQVVCNPPRPLIQELDALPFPDFDFSRAYYIHDGQARRGILPEGSTLHASYPILSGRGCPFSCSYCCNSMLRDLYGAKGYIRVRSLDTVLREIAEARRRNPRIEIIEFHDDVFGIRMEWLRKFSEVFPRRVGLPFSAYTHASTCTEERVALLKKAGIAFTILGIQSGSQRILREVYHRTTTREQILNTVGWLRRAGITFVLDFIGFNPLETEEDYRETFDLLMAIPPGFAMHDINMLSVYRNYPIARKLHEAGLLNPMLPGRNVTGGSASPLHRFWKAILTLTQFSTLDRDILPALIEDPYLRKHPQVVEALAQSLVSLTYLPGTRTFRAGHHERTQSELETLKGSRVVKAWLRIKKILGR
jgi:radical SAM superfamily enzyme YgiQ (UPF0313 family)